MQTPREALAQSDHDALVELKVLNRSVLEEIRMMKESMKEIMTNQVTNMTTWELKLSTLRDTQDLRLRALESALTKYVPDYVVKFDSLITDVAMLKTNKAETLVGWKVFIWIAGSLAGFISFAILLINFLSQWKIR